LKDVPFEQDRIITGNRLAGEISEAYDHNRIAVNCQHAGVFPRTHAWSDAADDTPNDAFSFLPERCDAPSDWCCWITGYFRLASSQVRAMIEGVRTAMQERAWWIAPRVCVGNTGMRRLILLDCFKVFFYVDRFCRDDGHYAPFAAN
jgi:hypothetical protein